MLGTAPVIIAQSRTNNATAVIEFVLGQVTSSDSTKQSH